MLNQCQTLDHSAVEAGEMAYGWVSVVLCSQSCFDQDKQNYLKNSGYFCFKSVFPSVKVVTEFNVIWKLSYKYFKFLYIRYHIYSTNHVSWARNVPPYLWEKWE